MEHAASLKKLLPQKSPIKLRCLSVIIPVYNESPTLNHLLNRVLAVPIPKEIILVDDASSDGTADVLKLIEKDVAGWKNSGQLLDLKVVVHKKNMGKGAAIRTGIEHVTGELTIIQDADLEYNPEEYPTLIEPILSGHADVVYGSRFSGNKRRVLYFWHTVGNKFLTLLSNIFTNLNLTDMETCYKVFKSDILKELPLRSNRFGFEPEITAKISKLKCVVYEIPISYQGRSYSEGKKISWKDGFWALCTIFRFWIFEDIFKKDSGHRTLRIMEGAGDYNQWLFNQAAPFLGKRIVEVGSGIGNITKYLTGVESLVATDLNPLYLEELNRKFYPYQNVHVRSLNLLDREKLSELASEFHPDTILSMNVLEHIEDDSTSVNNLFHMLKSGDRVVLVLPAHKWLYSDMDKNLGHYRRYSKKACKKILNDAGFEIEECKYLNFLGAIGWFVNGKILRRKIIPSRQVRLFDYLVKVLFFERLIQPPFGLSVFVVAKKP